MEGTSESPVLDEFEVNNNDYDNDFISRFSQNPLNAFSLFTDGNLQEYFMNNSLEKIVIHVVLIVISLCGIKAQTSKIIYVVRLLFWKIYNVINNLVNKVINREKIINHQVVDNRFREFEERFRLLLLQHDKNIAKQDDIVQYNKLDNFAESIKSEFNLKVAEMERRFQELKWRCDMIANKAMNTIVLANTVDSNNKDEKIVFDEGSVVQYNRE
ncbi:NSP4 [Adult diarrheal rotavirus strain J19]|uniref:Non-structural glycoprotein 4 n=1 Tax=Rotavirus X (strain RVX/Human/China/NADRV-J19/1997/GXP[X]) TaxID=335103 RepID=NSP4_ROTJ1|nr:NSP4 [Adult diarrheal rotavirus strain J19]Q45UF1.1 RecName: Full=Non-structural glycoprotein 4; Short=NSP4; AltName: Full=NCVP5; AltName: Full=NS28 [Adult diarrheal rotavirus strain J19]AAZ03494.1 NSP4 [Adult diarrheal rotavirus strain J19]